MKTKLEIKKRFEDIFFSLCNRYNPSEVLDDLLTIIICCFSIQEYEDDYFTVIKKYNKDIINKDFPEMFSLLILYYDKSVKDNILDDFLGDLYENITSRFKSSGLGQFFTPDTLCVAMTKMLGINNEIGIIGNDPACGSGRLCISGFLDNKHSFWIGADIDRITSKMAIVNFYLYGMINCEVWQMDTLSLNINQGYRVCLVEKEIEGKIIHIPAIRKIKEEEYSKRFVGCSIYFERLIAYCQSGQYKKDYLIEQDRQNDLIRKLRSIFDKLPYLELKTNNKSESYIEPLIENNYNEFKSDKTETEIEIKQKELIHEFIKTKKDKNLEQIGQFSFFD